MKDNMNQLLTNTLTGILKPNEGHENRFLSKLKSQTPKKKKRAWIPIAIAASLALSFGIIYFNDFSTQPEVVSSPPVCQETHDYFSSVINSGIEKFTAT